MIDETTLAEIGAQFQRIHRRTRQLLVLIWICILADLVIIAYLGLRAAGPL